MHDRPERFCGGCGGWLNDPAVEGQILAPDAPTRAAQASCPRCGYLGVGATPFCANCGLRVAPPQPLSTTPSGTVPSGRLSHATLTVMLGIQVLLFVLAWYLFDHDHSTTGRIFVAGIVVSGLANLARAASLRSATPRGLRWRRPPRGRQPPQ